MALAHAWPHALTLCLTLLVCMTPCMSHLPEVVSPCAHILQLQGKTDQKFVENAFRFVRDCFNIKTVLTPQHFLEQVWTYRTWECS